MCHIFVSHLFAPHTHLPLAIFSISSDSSPLQGLDKHHPCACLLPYLFDPVDGKVGSACNNNNEELTVFYVGFE